MSTTDQTMPSTLGEEAITTAAPVRGITWRDCADAADYLLSGPCRQVIPTCGGFGALGAGDTITLRYKIWTAVQATHRVWTIGIGAPAQDEAPPRRIIFTDPSGGASTADDVTQTQSFQHIETIATPADGLIEAVITLENTGALAGLISYVGCFEVSRPDLAIDASELGVDPYSFSSGSPIRDAVGYSLGALPESTAAARSLPRTLFQFAVPTDDAITVTGTAAPLFSYDPPLLDRQLYRSETQVEVNVHVYTRSSAGTTGTFDLAMTSGDTLSIPVTAADAGTWRTGTILIDAEDLSTADGRRSGVFDQATWTGTRLTGAGSIRLESLLIVGRST